MQEIVTSPNQNDVLAGRGCGSQLHPGNVKFRNIVRNKKQIYTLLKGNKQKNQLALEVYQEIKALDPPGRFLSKSSDGSWTPQDEKSVIVKIKQALRERLASSPRPNSANHGVKRTQSQDTQMTASLPVTKQHNNYHYGSFTLSNHYSEFRSFLISDSPYLMSLASDDYYQTYIKRFIARVYLSLTWEEFANMCDYHYKEGAVEELLQAIWKLYPFLQNAYYLDNRPDKQRTDAGIKIVRKIDANRREMKATDRKDSSSCHYLSFERDITHPAARIC